MKALKRTLLFLVFDVTSAPQTGKKISKIYAYLKKNENKQVSL